MADPDSQWIRKDRRVSFTSFQTNGIFPDALIFTDILAMLMMLAAESRAIMRYIAEKYAGQGTDLLGETLEVCDIAVPCHWLIHFIEIISSCQ